MRTFIGMLLLLALAAALDEVVLNGRYRDVVVADAKVYAQRARIGVNSALGKLGFRV